MKGKAGEHSTMKGGRNKALVIASLLLITLFSTIAVNASAEVREESPNFIRPVGFERFSSGWMDSSYSDNQRENIDVRYYYPSSNGGENVPLDCSWAPYPWIAFHADDGESFDSYSWLGEGLSKAGYFVVVIGEERSGDEIYQAISDHSELISTIGYINLTGDSNKGPSGAQGCIDMDHWGVAGHGRGAGLATVVTSYWGAIFSTGQFQPPRALFGFGLDTDDIGVDVNAIDMAHPKHSLFLTGTMDNIAPINEHIKPLLDQWNSGWQLLEVVGANHVQYEDDQSFFDNLMDGDATMTEEEQQQHAINKIKPYLDLTLKGEDESWHLATSRENNPSQPSDSESYLSENLSTNQFYRINQTQNLIQAPNARSHPILFFDPVGNQTILAAGWGENAQGFNDMWALDLLNSREWEEKSGGPNSIGTNAFASNGWAGGLLSGSSNSNNPTLWRWSGWSSSWTSYPENLRPPGEVGQSLVWDSISSRYISYGGVENNGLKNNETWTFEPNSAIWQNLSASNSPKGKELAAMFFSEGWNRSILFGGVAEDGNLSNETWMFNGETNSWSKLQLPGDSPSARFDMATTIDYENQIAYIFGGRDANYHLSNELWSFNLNTLVWTKLASTGIKEISSAGIAFDNASNNLVLFGGNSLEGLSDETWLYNFTENEWNLHSSSSAITSTDVIHIAASVTERDLDSPPDSLEVHCQVIGETNWVTGIWDNVNDTASCQLSPFSLPPGFHTASLRVLHEGKRASIQTTFERANAPPQLINPMPYFVIIEEGDLTINASDIASDVDGHELRFIGNTFVFAPLHEGDIEPELDFILQNDRKSVKFIDLADWSDRSGNTWYTVCGEIRDESTPGNPPARVPFCFELLHQGIDDPYSILEEPTITIEEDSEWVEFDIAPFVTDQEGDPPAIYWHSQFDYYSSDDRNVDVNRVQDDFGDTSNFTFSPALNWHGTEVTEFCILRYGLYNHEKSVSDCTWLNVTFVVTPIADAPIFNYTEFDLQEDSVTTIALNEIVWDPDGDEVNVTLEAGESNVTLELWHETLRITPETNWNGRAVNWAIIASDGQHEIRQPLRIIINEIDDKTIVEWDEPRDIVNNLTELRLIVNDVDSDGPWLIEYHWDDEEWKEISPSCAALDNGNFECQADLLVHDLSYGDHKLYLRVNDGESTSDAESFWLEKANPDTVNKINSDSSAGFMGTAFIIGGIVLLLSGGALIYSLINKQEYS